MRRSCRRARTETCAEEQKEERKRVYERLISEAVANAAGITREELEEALLEPY